MRSTLKAARCRSHICAGNPSFHQLRVPRSVRRPVVGSFEDGSSSREDMRGIPGASSLDYNAGTSTIQSGSSAGDDFGYMEEYKQLKAQLLDNTRKSGAAIGLYLLLTVDGKATLACMLGTAASYAYFSWLCYDIDNVKPTDTVPIWEANKVQTPGLRWIAKLAAAYRTALRPRLLVLVGLAALLVIYNRLAPEPVPLIYEGCLLGGFLAYKAALVVKLLDELTPKTFMSSDKSRPSVAKIEDELDQWGRPKKELVTSPIEVMPKDAQEQAYKQLEKQLSDSEAD